MIYVFEGENNNASWANGDYLTEEVKKKGIAIEQLPVEEEYEGKYAVLKCNFNAGEVWYEYKNIPLSPESLQIQKVEQLESENAQLLLRNVMQEVRINGLEEENAFILLKLAIIEGGVTNV